MNNTQATQKPKIDLNLKLICRDCRDPVPNIIEDFAKGDMICGNCGLILGARTIDTRSEWRTFANSDDNSGDPSRVGAMQDPLLGGSNHLESTMISGLDKGTGMSRDLSRTHAKISQDRSTKMLVEAFKSIQHMADSITLPRLVSDSAKQLFKRVDDEKLLKGKSLDAIKACCLYIACKQHNATRTFKEICNLTKVSKKEIGKCYKTLQPHMQHAEAGSLDSYIYRFTSQLSLDNKVRAAGLKVLKKVTELGVLDGKSPISVVAACLYFVSCLSKEPATARAIADTAQCTEGTLKNAYKLLLEVKEQIGSDLDMHHPLSSLPL